MSADLQSALHKMAADREFAASMHGASREHHFRIPVYGPGRIADKELYFGMAFVDEPFVSHGIQIMEGDSVINTAPRAQVTVSRWRRTYTGLYLGAWIDATVTGHRRQRVHLHVMFSGTAIAFPIGKARATYSTDDII